MRRFTSAVSRVLEDIARTRTLGQLAKIDNSKQVRELPECDRTVVAAAASDRMIAVDYDLPVPRSSA